MYWVWNLLWMMEVGYFPGFYEWMSDSNTLSFGHEMVSGSIDQVSHCPSMLIWLWLVPNSGQYVWPNQFYGRFHSFEQGINVLKFQHDIVGCLIGHLWSIHIIGAAVNHHHVWVIPGISQVEFVVYMIIHTLKFHPSDTVENQMWLLEVWETGLKYQVFHIQPACPEQDTVPEEPNYFACKKECVLEKAYKSALLSIIYLPQAFICSMDQPDNLK